MPLIDLHVHPTLPILGPLFGRLIHDFDPGTPSHLGKTINVTTIYQLCFRGHKKDDEAVYQDFRQVLQRWGSTILSDAAQYRSFWAEEQRQMGTILAIESLRPFAALEHFDRYRALGVKLLQPVHFWDNRFGNSYRFGIIEPSIKGLTSLGKDLLGYAAQHGLGIDVAHMNRASIEDVLSIFHGPVLCSHTGLTELRNRTRNLPAALARQLIARGGVIGITPWKHLLPTHKPFSLAAWVSAFAETAAAFAELGEGRGICVGSDLGAPFLISPKFFGPQGIELLAEALVKKGLDEEFLQALLWKNAKAFFDRLFSLEQEKIG